MSSVWPARSEWDISKHLCSVFGAAGAKEGAAAQMGFKKHSSLHNREVCSEPHNVLVCEQDHEGQAGGAGPQMWYF